MSCPYSGNGSSKGMTRRDFLKAAGLVGLAAALVGAPTLSAVAAPQALWHTKPWEGENWTQCHALRDGKDFARLPAPTEEVDVVVVGGGMTGLLTAYMLRDRNVVVLEKSGRPGGNSRRAQWEGVWYPLGALYITKPIAEIAALFKAIGVAAHPIPRPVDAMLLNGKVIPDFFGEGVEQFPYDPEVRKAFRDTWKHFADFLESPDLPAIPVSASTKKAMVLDTMSFAEYCARQGFNEQVVSLMDTYTRSCWGVGNEVVSAFGVINFLASEFEPTYAFPGGNGAISDALAKHLGSRIRVRSFADRIIDEGKTVRVDYVRDGRPACIRARQVVVSAPMNIALAAMPSAPSALKQVLGDVRYGSYLAGEIFLNEPLGDHAFDLWTEGRWYTDLCLADWVATRGKPGKRKKTVMTASIPMGELDGRVALLETKHAVFAERLMAELVKDFPDARDKVAGFQFARYGHPMVIPYPGYMAKMAPQLRKPYGRIRLAHTDIDGLPCFEVAYATAVRVSREVHDELRARVALTAGG